MAEVVLQATEEQITCSICFDIFEEPRALPCLHTFCKKCIHDHIKQQVENTYCPRGFRCPVCRRFVSAPRGKESIPQTWASALEANHVIVSLIEAFKTPRSKSQNCCKEHPGKELEMYCFDHRKFICCVCSLKHRTCQDLQTREDALQRMSSDPALSPEIHNSDSETTDDVLKELVEQLSIVEKQIQLKKDKISNLEQQETEIQQTITTIKREMIERLEQEEAATLSKISKRKEKEVQKIEREIKKLNKMISRTTSNISTLQDAINTNNKQDVERAMTSAKTVRETCQKKIENIHRKGDRQSLEFHINSLVQEFLSKFESFGDIFIASDDQCNIKKGSSNDTKALNPETDKTQMMWRSYSTMDSRIPYWVTPPIPARRQRLVSSMNLETQNDHKTNTSTVRSSSELIVNPCKHKLSWITGLVVLGNGKIILVDYHNSRLMLFDSDQTLLSELTIHPAPYDVTVISDDEFLVTRPDCSESVIDGNIIDDSLVVGMPLATKIQARCLNFSGGFLAVCASAEVQLFERNESYWTERYRDSFTRSKFTYVAVEGKKEYILLTDQRYPDPQLICMDFSGNVVWRFSHLDLNFPSGISLYDRYIFVASWDKCSVLQLEMDGSYLGTLFVDVRFPWKIAVGSRNKQLVISQHQNSLPEEIKRSVKIFQLGTQLQGHV